MTCDTSQICAQRLVTQGYGGYLRRNYLVQVVNDDVAELRVASEEAKNVFEQHRVEQWTKHGVIPRRVLYGLIKYWIGGGHLPSGGACNAGKPGATATSPPPNFFVDIGITFAGFEKLESHTQLVDVLRKKAPAYAEGAFWRASSQLGDAGASAPSRWEQRYQGDGIHLVFVVHATRDDSGEAGFSDFELAVLRSMDTHPDPTIYKSMSTHWIEKSIFLDDPKALHFDMLDGLSAPRFEGIDTKAQIEAEADFNVHKPGELLLGHDRNDESNPWRVPGAFAQETVPVPLRKTPSREAYGEFFKDGSFGVLRKMQQNVPEFNGFLKREADKIQGARTLEYTVGWLKAKMLGRWPNGEPVGELIETTDNIERNPAQRARIIATAKSKDSATPDNKFSFKQDLEGFKCPYGAHIRRMNPRDDPVVPILRRPLLRRGAPYGEKFEDGKKDTGNRGLLGLFFCANLEEQFEHLLGNWANNNPMGMPFRQHGKDPLIGNQDLIGNGFEIPMRTGGSLLLEGLRTFVQTRGTCYAFFPSVPSLLKIASGRIATSTLFLEKISPPCQTPGA